MSVTSHESIAPSRRTSVIFGYLLLSLLYAWNTPGAVVPIPLDLVEMGLPEDMTAEVVADEPCPRIESGLGRLVLTTVNHLNRDVHTLTVTDTAGKVDNLGVTGFHKFYSLHRSAWVSCKDLHDNEQIRGFPDRLTVLARSPLPGTHRVYNMTVEAEHVYHVGALGVLAHNNGCSQRVGHVAGDAADSTPNPSRTIGSENAYSVAFRTELPSGSFPGGSRGHHFQQANQKLIEAMDADPTFARQIESLIPSIREQLVKPRGYARQPPKDWTWHHHVDTGMMELVPRIQHDAPGPLQQRFHPDGRGGMSMWGN